MSANLYPGSKSLHLVLDQPYDEIRTTDLRDDLQSVKVWYSKASGFDPTSTDSAVDKGTLYSNNSDLSINITGLDGSTKYYVKYAFISAIDPDTYTVEGPLDATTLDDAIRVSGYLTNSGKGISTNAAGDNADLSLTAGVFKVYDYAKDVTGGVGLPSGTGPVYAVKANSSIGMTVTINATTGAYIATAFTGSDGLAILTATYNNVVIEQELSFYKGYAGQLAPVLQLTSPVADFVYKNENATLSDTPSATITATRKNITGTIVWTTQAFARDGTMLGTGSQQVAYSTGTDSITITNTQFQASFPNTLGYVAITATIGNVFDTYTINRINSGTNQIVAEIINGTAQIPADASGTIDAAHGYIGSGCTIRVLEGNIPLEVDRTSPYDSIATWSIFDITATGITPGTATFPVDSGTGKYLTIVIGDHSAMTADKATIVYTIYYRSTTGQTGSTTVTQTFTKSKQGITGSSAKVVVLTATSQAFVVAKNTGTVSPSNSVLTATTTNMTSPVYAWYLNDTIISGATTNTYTVAPFANGIARYKVTATENGITVYDQLSIYALKEGDDSYQAGLSNENQTVSCLADGTPISGQFPITSQMIVAQGAQFLTSGVTYSKVSETSMTSTISNTGAISVSSISGTFASATYRASITGTTITIDRVLTLNKSLNGAAGTNGTNGTNGTPGTDGLRGAAVLTRSSTTDVSSYKSTGYSVSSSVGYECQQAFNSAYTGALDRTPRAGDRVNLFGTAYSNNYLFNGSTWDYIALVVDGSLVVNGTISTTALAISSSSSPDRIQLSYNKLEVFSGNNRRVVIGYF